MLVTVQYWYSFESGTKYMNILRIGRASIASRDKNRTENQQQREKELVRLYFVAARSLQH